MERFKNLSGKEGQVPRQPQLTRSLKSGFHMIATIVEIATQGSL